MSLLVGLLALRASIALAAPHEVVHRRQAPFSDIPLPTAPPDGFVPPPLTLIIGGVHTADPSAGQEAGSSARGAEHRNRALPLFLKIHTADVYTTEPLGTPVATNTQRQQATPAAVTDLDSLLNTRKVQNRNTLRTTTPADLPNAPPVDFTPPPLTLVIGGVHTMEPIGAKPFTPAPEERGRPIQGRQEETPSTTTFTTIYPSAGAPGTFITKQLQVVTTYLAKMTCQPQSSSSGDSINATESSCTTSLVPTVTAICATSLLPLATAPIPITDCNQYITYSSEYGYSLTHATQSAVATGMPPYKEAVQTMTTYWAAIWTGMRPGMKPTSGIEVVCADKNGACTTTTISIPTTSTGQASVATAAGSGSQSITATISSFITRTTSEVAVPGGPTSTVYDK